MLGIITGAVAGLHVTPAVRLRGRRRRDGDRRGRRRRLLLQRDDAQAAVRVDDSLDAFGVHGVGGILGSILTGVFASVTLGGTEQISIPRQVGVQLLACAATAAWSGGMSWVLMKVADAVLGVRADEEQETIGLDLTSHEERGYDLT